MEHHLKKQLPNNYLKINYLKKKKRKQNQKQTLCPMLLLLLDY